MPGIRSECHILIFSPRVIHVQEGSELLVQNLIYLQLFANNLPNVFTHGVISLSLCQNEWRYHLKTTQLPVRGGEVWSQEI